MTTKEKTEVNIVDGKCLDCDATVPGGGSGQDHEKTPQHQTWLDKVTTPEEPERAKTGDLEKLPQELREALDIMNDTKKVRDINKRMQLTAKQVRVVYSDNAYDDPRHRPEGVPATPRELLELFHVPILEDPRVIQRHLDEIDPFRRV